MQKTVANYTVIIEKEKRTGINKSCYTAFVPALDIATESDSIEQVQEDIQSLVQFHLESLAEENEEIPVETTSTFVTKIEASLPKNSHLVFS